MRSVTAEFPCRVSGNGPGEREAEHSRCHSADAEHTVRLKIITPTQNVDSNNVPRSVHFYGPHDPRHVFTSLSMLTGLTYFYLKEETAGVR